MYFLLLSLLLPPADGPERLPATPLTAAEEARRDALTRFGLGIWRTRLELPVQAVKQHESAAKADPNSAEALRPLVALYEEIGREPAAIRTAKRVLELDPQDTATAARLGRLLVRAKRYGDATLVYQNAVEQVSKSEPLLKLNLLRDASRAAELAQDWPTAVTWTDRSLTFLRENQPGLANSPSLRDESALLAIEAELLEQLADRCLSLKQFPEAIQHYETAAKLWAGSLKQPVLAARLQWNLANVYYGQERYEPALQALSKFIVLGPSLPEPYLRLAELYRKLNRRDEILGQLAQLQNRFPKVEAIRWALAAETLAQNPNLGRQPFDTLLEQSRSPKLLTIMIDAYTRQEQGEALLNFVRDLDQQAHPMADDNATKPKELTPTQRAKADLLRSICQAIKANSSASRMLLRVGLTVNLSGDTLQFLQELANQEGQRDLVLRLAKQAFELDPEKNFWNYYSLLFQARRWREALAACDQAESRQRLGAPGNRLWVTHYDYYRPIPLAEVGEGQRALILVNRIVANPNTRRVSALDRKMQLLNILGQYPDAIKIGEELLPTLTDPGDLRQIRLSLASIYDLAGRFVDAEKLYRDQLETDPDDALVLNNLGYHLADQGRKLDEAESMIRQAIELDRDDRARRGERELENTSYVDSLGWVLFRRGKLKEARTALEAAVKAYDALGDATPWDHLGDVAFRQGEVGRAREAWQKAAEYYQNSHVGQQNGRRAEVLRKLDQTR